MRKVYLYTCCVFLLVGVVCFSFKNKNSPGSYTAAYNNRLNSFKQQQQALLQTITSTDLFSPQAKEKITEQINLTRNHLKPIDFWMRYLEPIAYKKINGPLPVEWETEVFEKFEKPYKREGAGLTLAALYLEEEAVSKDSLLALVQASIRASETYSADSITGELATYHHFFLSNRLFLLNLAAIYTTGFECPDTERIIPELRLMLAGMENIYDSFNESFPATPLNDGYLALFKKMKNFANEQPDDYSHFDHFLFIRDFVNPLFSYNQKFIVQYNVVSKSFVDYALNKNAVSIFDKAIYRGQNPKGIFLRVTDVKALAEIDRLGKLLFYDPVLSANNLRSCASCHKPTAYFNDTATATAIQFNQKDFLPRNTPSLINAGYNHLLMVDGQHISLQNQTKSVITNNIEMGSDEKKVLQKVLSCAAYKKGFESLLQYTPQETEITFDHLVSAITFYYTKFSKYYAPFDEAMKDSKPLDAAAKNGFNLFMSKAQCATCHFVPQFNGVKPPFVGSEFEVLGVPADTGYKNLSPDKGRYGVNAAKETANAFRTGSIRNAAYTAPYMHNGVFNTLTQVVDFYDGGGGAGKGLSVPNQTLSADSLHLSVSEKSDLIAFMQSLNEKIIFEPAPSGLPASKITSLNQRKTGGVY